MGDASEHPRCATCSHFRAGNNRLGECMLIPQLWDIKDGDTDLAAVSDGEMYAASFHPHPDFYCAMHSEVFLPTGAD